MTVNYILEPTNKQRVQQTIQYLTHPNNLIIIKEQHYENIKNELWIKWAYAKIKTTEKKKKKKSSHCSASVAALQASNSLIWLLRSGFHSLVLHTASIVSTLPQLNMQTIQPAIFIDLLSNYSLVAITLMTMINVAIGWSLIKIHTHISGNYLIIQCCWNGSLNDLWHSVIFSPVFEPDHCEMNIFLS